jgi:site-specific recombinase XerD
LRSGPRARQSGARVSEITRRRYWRLLERIYAHALHRGWVSSNPAQDLAEADIPPQEDPQGAILAPAVWQALEALLDEGAAQEPKEVRKRAMLCCLLELGLMPMEVRGLMPGVLQYEPGGQGGPSPCCVRCSLRAPACTNAAACR